ncbi:hypothetical protein EDB84DRAFT_1524444 [Lactarius hengduanensis]|nr:hypothetical protein EDB84DRAFT_1524444 [Lactarius hengduanensis]
MDAKTFLGCRAEQYFQDFLKSKPTPPIEVVSYPDREGHFFLVSYYSRRILEQPFDTSSRLLDRAAVVNRGTVVPQTMWSPCTITDKRQRIEETALQMPIFSRAWMGDSVFPWKPRLLVDATVFVTHCKSFHLGKTRRHMSALLGPATESSSVRFRFVTRRASPISIYRFAHHIGRSVDAFLKFLSQTLGVPTTGASYGRSGHVASGGTRSWLLARFTFLRGVGC